MHMFGADDKIIEIDPIVRRRAPVEMAFQIRQYRRHPSTAIFTNDEYLEAKISNAKS